MIKAEVIDLKKYELLTVLLPIRSLLDNDLVDEAKELINKIIDISDEENDEES